MEINLHSKKGNIYYFDKEQEIDEVKMSIEDNEYVSITCKDGSHMVLNDVKEIKCNKIKGTNLISDMEVKV